MNDQQIQVISQEVIVEIREEQIGQSFGDYLINAMKGIKKDMRQPIVEENDQNAVNGDIGQHIQPAEDPALVIKHTTNNGILAGIMTDRVCLITIGVMLLVLLIFAIVGPSVTPSVRIVTLIGTNDIHGTAFPTEMKRLDTGQEYNYGGIMYMARLIQILQSENKGNTLYVDAGDQYQGGIESSTLISAGVIMNQFYTQTKLNSSAIGNHEFDEGPSFLLPYMTAKNGTNLAANLRNGTQSLFLPKQQLSSLVAMDNGINLGLIGLTTLETPATTSGFSPKKFKKFDFLDYPDIVIEEAKKLRSKGAHAIIVVAHVGNSCPTSNLYGNWTAQNDTNSCDYDEISKLIDRIPEGTIDAIVQGHRHKFAHHYYKGVAYMGTINGGFYLNAMYLYFDGRGRVIKKTIEGPIPVCERIFSNLDTCGFVKRQDLPKAGQLISWKFHGQDVYASKQLSQLYEKDWADKMKPYFEELTITEIPMQISFRRQNELANYITNMVKKALPTTDFMIMNPGGFRTMWLPGVLDFADLYNMFPFQNIVSTFDMTGQQLLDTLTIIQSGAKGFYHSYGLVQTVNYTYKNDIHQFVSATLSNGMPINPTQTYRGVSIDFLLEGGDDFKDVIGKVYTVRNQIKQGIFKDLVKPQIKSSGIIKAGTLIDPQNPRLIVNYLDTERT